MTTVSFTLDGRAVDVPDDGGSLLDALREHLGARSVKDGCSPQGQCGCCTVWVDGSPRVSCVTPTRRVAGRVVTTVDGLDPEVRARWADAFVATGASQCGFCTPGIVMRLAGLGRGGNRPVDEPAIRTALLAHLCRCTGWRTVVEAASAAIGDAAMPRTTERDPLFAAWRAQIEGRSLQVSGVDTVLGRGGFADDTAPPDALVALSGERDEAVVAVDLPSARARSGKVQGRNSTMPLRHPVDLPEGEWYLTLRTTWVEPGYLEPDASWCEPGGEPATPLANGGAFGAKRGSPVPDEARRLADAHGRAVRRLWSREEVVRRGPKRPPVAIAVAEDGTGIVRFGRGGSGAPSLAVLSARVASVAPGLAVEEVAVSGPPTSADLRGSGWVEAAVVVAALDARRRGRVGPGAEVEVTGPSGGRARAMVGADGAVAVEVSAGEVLDAVTLRSFCIGAVHQALGWVRSEGIAVDDWGGVHDLTIRSFGILSARDTPRVDVVMHRSDRWPVNGSDAVFAATAAAVWLADGLPPEWPTRRGRRGGGG